MRPPLLSFPPSLFAVTLLVATIPCLQGQSLWINSSGGDISTPGNWSSGVPTLSQDGAFYLNNTYTVGVLNDFSARSLFVSAGNVTVDIASGQTLGLAYTGTTNTGIFFVQAGTATITGSGTLSAQAGFGVYGTATLLSTHLVSAAGLGLDLGGSLTINNSSVQAGTVAIGTGRITQVSGTMQAPEMAVASGSGAAGSYNLSGGTVLITGSSSDGSGGSLRVGDFSGSGTFNQTGGLVQLTTTSTAGNSLVIGNQGGTGVYNISSGTLAFAGSGLLAMGRSADTNPAASGTLNISGNSLVDFAGSGTSASFIIGDNVSSTNNGYGILNQTSGTLSIHDGATLYLSGFAPTISGTNTYNLLGGVLQIGGNSLKAYYNGSSPYAFNLGGGTIRVTGSNLTTSVNATLVSSSTSVIDTNGFNAAWNGNISGSNSQLVKIGSGTLSLSGTNQIDSFFALGGAIAQTSGTITSFEVGVGSGVTGTIPNAGAYNMSGGTLLIAAGTPPSFIGSSSSLRVGDWGGSGTFNQTGGNVIVNGSLNIGNQGGSGVYNLNGGVLTLASGNNVLGRSTGANPASSGTMNIGGGLLQIQSGGALIIGNNISGAALGSGVVNQTSGTVHVNNDSNLFLSGFGNGTYNLTGGVLEVGANSLQARYNNTTSTYAFNLGGGTIRVTGTDLTTGVNAKLISGSSSAIDTNGLNATWNGSFTGTNAQLVKMGAGNLNITGTNQIDSFFTIGGSLTQTSGTTTSYEVGVGSGLSGTSANVGVYNMAGGTLLLAAGTPPPLVGGAGSSIRIGDFGGSGTFNQTGGSVVVNGSLNIGNQGGHGVYNVNSGTLNLASGLSTLGRTNGSSASSGGSTGVLNISGSGVVNVSGSSTLVGSNWYPSSGIVQGSGTINQTGGLLNVDNTASLILTGLGDGTYNLTSGTLQIGGSSLIGVFGGQNGAYHFNLGGGTIRVAGSDLVTSVNASILSNTSSTLNTNGFNATWNGSLSGSNGQLVKAGTGNLTITGTNRIDSFFANGGSLTQTSGTTTSFEVGVGSGVTGTIANTGVYNMAGGTLLIAAGTPPPFVGGSASSFRVGDFGGSGTFNQTGGDVVVNGSLNIGNQGGHGVYAISSGTLDLASGMSTLGRTSGSSASSGGSTGELNISGSGVVNVSGTAYLIASNWYPNSGITQGSGVINQTGGLLNVDNTASLIVTGLGDGTYNLNGGTLQIGGNSLIGVFGGQNGTYHFNLGGGTIRVAGSNLATSADMTVSGSASVIDTGSFSGTFNGAFLGSGRVTKNGSGTMFVNSASSTASIAVSQGTLSGSGKTTGSVAVASGAKLAGAVNIGGTTTIEQGATFSPGNSPAAVYNDGDLVMAGTMYIELSGTTGGSGTFTAPVTGDYDQVLYGGASGITLADDATIQIASLDSFVPQRGDIYAILLTTGSITADYSSIIVEGLDSLSDYRFYLTTGTSGWNGSGDYQTVLLHVEAIPEPGICALLGLGGALLLIVRRRKIAIDQ